eukprot:6053758-Pyramimonas_sp.AAC.1
MSRGGPGQSGLRPSEGRASTWTAQTFRLFFANGALAAPCASPLLLAFAGRRLAGPFVPLWAA